MEELLQLLSDGRSRTIEMLAAELGTTNDDILRKIDFLERSKIIRRVATSYSKKCAGCSHGGNCSSQACAACMPEGGFKNMGSMWEIIK
jgi:DNA-binding Lrp family transcriptional regulator